MKVDKSKFICELGGYKYYLGDVIASSVDWFTAKELVEGLGDGWELPSREVAINAHNKLQKEMKSEGGWYWLGDEHSSSSAWTQYSTDGLQFISNKVSTFYRYVRPVYKEKVKTSNPKIKLLRIVGFSDLVLDIDGKKVLYELGDYPAIHKEWELSRCLDKMDKWVYEVVHEDFDEWLSQQQESKNNSSNFKKVFHIREKDEDGNILARGGATVVFVEGSDGSDGYIALCHPDDNYNKKVGVEVALSKKPYFKTPEVVGVVVNNTTPSCWKRLVKSLTK